MTLKLKQYQVDAFTDRVFGGNPAAVVPLSSWLDDSLLQAIAEENNLSETAFFVPSAAGYELRWFTPATEVDLCGHATLAAAHIIFELLGYDQTVISFATRSGELRVSRSPAGLAMSLPAGSLRACEPPQALLQGLGRQPIEVLAGDDYMAVFADEAAVRALAPDHAALGQLELRGVIATAPGANVDFVSRFFAPKVGIPEDPVTGSAHCELAPYWGAKLAKRLLRARQISSRGGDLTCELDGDRVIVAGAAVVFMQGEIELDHPR